MSGSLGKPSSEEDASIRASMAADMANWKASYGEAFERPNRGDLKAAGGCLWRHGAPPDYTIADHAFLSGKTQEHGRGETTQTLFFNIWLKKYFSFHFFCLL